MSFSYEWSTAIHVCTTWTNLCRIFPLSVEIWINGYSLPLSSLFWRDNCWWEGSSEEILFSLIFKLWNLYKPQAIQPTFAAGHTVQITEQEKSFLRGVYKPSQGRVFLINVALGRWKYHEETILLLIVLIKQATKLQMALWYALTKQNTWSIISHKNWTKSLSR